MKPLHFSRTPDGRFQLEAETWLPAPPGDLFPFFADAANLEKLTPPWLRFQIITPQPIVMGEGTLIDYRLRIHGLPIKWRTRINAWEPPHRFVDEQLRGPYRQWIHAHTFESHAGGTRARDRVQYDMFLGGLVHRWLVRPDIERIFRYRAQEMRQLFGAAE